MYSRSLSLSLSFARHRSNASIAKRPFTLYADVRVRTYKAAFHDADTDILARIVARMLACLSACHMNNFRKSSACRT